MSEIIDGGIAPLPPSKMARISATATPPFCLRTTTLTRVLITNEILL
jgi:hypothetical protein